MKKIILHLIIIGFILVSPKAHAHRSCWGPSFGISYNVGPYWASPYYHSHCNDSAAFVAGTTGLMTGLALANARDPRTQAEIEEDKLRAEEIRQRRAEKRQKALDERLKKEEEREERRRRLREERDAERDLRKNRRKKLQQEDALLEKEERSTKKHRFS
jgi:hypothetical protein